MKRLGSLVLGAALAAGCSGGSGTTPAAPKNGGSTTLPAGQKVSVTMKLATPVTRKPAGVRTGRHLDYVSPSSAGAVITATSSGNSANNAAFGYDLSVNNAACVPNSIGGSLDCTLTIPLAVDTYSITLDLYDQNETGSAGSPGGTLLSTQTQTLTVQPAPASNIFTFDPNAFVAGWCLCAPQNQDGGAIARGRAPAAARRPHTLAAMRPQALASAQPGPIFGAQGASSTSFTIDALALDRDGNEIDQYPGNTTFVNGTFAVSIAESGDESGSGSSSGNSYFSCASDEPCTSVSNALGTSYGSPAPSPPPTPALIPLAVPSDEALGFSYSGGGGVGGGIAAWPTPGPSASPSTSPSGARPYFADVSIPNTASAIAPYVVPHAYLAPLFAYATVGSNQQFSGTASGQKIFVWAAQALVPTGESSTGSSYSALFGSSSTCTDTGGNVAAQVVGQTFFSGYGEVFTVNTTVLIESTTTPIQCQLTVSDGDGDSQVITIPVATEVIG